MQSRTSDHVARIRKMVQNQNCSTFSLGNLGVSLGLCCGLVVKLKRIKFMGRLTNIQRGVAVGLHEANSSNGAIANRFGVNA